MSKIVCISYVPTSTTLSTFGILNMSPEDIIDHFQKLEPSLPNGCVWAIKDKAVCLILIIDNAKSVFDNTMAWSEENPSKWFYFGIKNNKTHYTMGLFPNLSESLNRFKNHQKELNRQIIKETDEVQMLFHPLGFTSTLETFNKIKNLLPSTIDIGFSQSVEDIDNNNIYWLTGIKRSKSEYSTKYISTYLMKTLSSITP